MTPLALATTVVVASPRASLLSRRWASGSRQSLTSVCDCGTWSNRLSDDAADLVIYAKLGLSLLDRSRTRVGEAETATLTGNVARAAQAEGLRYDRFWVAEHHGVPGVVGAAPAVLLAA